jgi:KTSC domain
MPSTVIRGCAYDLDHRELRITFTSGRRYIYSDVPPEKFSAFTHAASRGSFFNREIRDVYAFREMKEQLELV